MTNLLDFAFEDAGLVRILFIQFQISLILHKTFSLSWTNIFNSFSSQKRRVEVHQVGVPGLNRMVPLEHHRVFCGLSDENLEGAGEFINSEKGRIFRMKI